MWAVEDGHGGVQGWGEEEDEHPPPSVPGNRVELETPGGERKGEGGRGEEGRNTGGKAGGRVRERSDRGRGGVERREREDEGWG